MRKIQAMFRIGDAPLHFVEDDDLNVGDVFEGEYRGGPLTVKVVEVREGREKHTLGVESLGSRPVRICIVVRPRL